MLTRVRGMLLMRRIGICHARPDFWKAPSRNVTRNDGVVFLRGVANTMLPQFGAPYALRIFCTEWRGWWDTRVQCHLDKTPLQIWADEENKRQRRLEENDKKIKEEDGIMSTAGRRTGWNQRKGSEQILRRTSEVEK